MKKKRPYCGQLRCKMRGRFSSLGHVGPAGFEALNKPRLQGRKEVEERLKSCRKYYLNPNKKMPLAA